MKAVKYLAVACLFGIVAGCGSLPKDTVVVTCKPIIRQGQVNWQEGSSAKIPRSHSGQAITWPILVLQDGRHTLVIHFADKGLLNMLKTDQIYTFAVLPPRRDELGIAFPKVLRVEQGGKRIYP